MHHEGERWWHQENDGGVVANDDLSEEANGRGLHHEGKRRWHRENRDCRG